MRRGINRKRTVRSSGGFWSPEDIGGGLILLMRLQCGTITVSRGALDLDYFETQNEAFIQKMRSENTLGMFFVWFEKVVRIGIRNVL